jgi:hypothetical protein
MIVPVRPTRGEMRGEGNRFAAAYTSALSFFSLCASSNTHVVQGVSANCSALSLKVS